MRYSRYRHILARHVRDTTRIDGQMETVQHALVDVLRDVVICLEIKNYFYMNIYREV
jgi:hypothetical protein